MSRPSFSSPGEGFGLVVAEVEAVAILAAAPSPAFLSVRVLVVSFIVSRVAVSASGVVILVTVADGPEKPVEQPADSASPNLGVGVSAATVSIQIEKIVQH